MCRLLRIPAGSLAAMLLSLTAALQPSPCTRRTLTRRNGLRRAQRRLANDETVSKLDYGDNAGGSRAAAARASVDRLWRVEMTCGVPTKDRGVGLFGQAARDARKAALGEAVEATLRLTNGAVEVAGLGAPARPRRAPTNARTASYGRDSRLPVSLGHLRRRARSSPLRRRRHRRTSSVSRVPPGPTSWRAPSTCCRRQARLRAQGRSFRRPRGCLGPRPSPPAGSFTAARNDRANSRLKFMAAAACAGLGIGRGRVATRWARAFINFIRGTSGPATAAERTRGDGRC